MPRERVENCAGSPWQPVVGWGYERGVQVATVAEGERSVYWLLLGNTVEDLERLGGKVRMIAGGAPADADRATDEEIARTLLNTMDVLCSSSGLSADLDRRGCNDLIRLLRRARDAAYGRDE